MIKDSRAARARHTQSVPSVTARISCHSQNSDNHPLVSSRALNPHRASVKQPHWEVLIPRDLKSSMGLIQRDEYSIFNLEHQYDRTMSSVEMHASTNKFLDAKIRGQGVDIIW